MNGNCKRMWNAEDTGYRMERKISSHVDRSDGDETEKFVRGSVHVVRPTQRLPPFETS